MITTNRGVLDPFGFSDPVMSNMQSGNVFRNMLDKTSAADTKGTGRVHTACGLNAKCLAVLVHHVF